ncbi:hypothetical protein BLNAU_22255 [Blattamonas nauphoetae]|uniref:Uncharacterized protein n=1 Tax=Blattamonas nauphoetae TaxID=2049346 RepID=A0ABQ9WTM7_9EUKA|nr:hypothetical protein BLNAU_22255 [Blattamonas nauphoetae]
MCCSLEEPSARLSSGTRQTRGCMGWYTLTFLRCPSHIHRSISPRQHSLHTSPFPHLCLASTRILSSRLTLCLSLETLTRRWRCLILRWEQETPSLICTTRMLGTSSKARHRKTPLSQQR